VFWRGPLHEMVCAENYGGHFNQGLYTIRRTGLITEFQYPKGPDALRDGGPTPVKVAMSGMENSGRDSGHGESAAVDPEPTWTGAFDQQRFAARARGCKCGRNTGRSAAKNGDVVLAVDRHGARGFSEGLQFPALRVAGDRVREFSFSSSQQERHGGQGSFGGARSAASLTRAKVDGTF
jgi:hypothetical protein